MGDDWADTFVDSPKFDPSTYNKRELAHRLDSSILPYIILRPWPSSMTYARSFWFLFQHSTALSCGNLQLSCLPAIHLRRMMKACWYVKHSVLCFRESVMVAHLSFTRLSVETKYFYLSYRVVTAQSKCRHALIVSREGNGWAGWETNWSYCVVRAKIFLFQQTRRQLCARYIYRLWSHGSHRWAMNNLWNFIQNNT